MGRNYLNFFNLLWTALDTQLTKVIARKKSKLAPLTHTTTKKCATSDKNSNSANKAEPKEKEQRGTKKTPNKVKETEFLLFY